MSQRRPAGKLTDQQRTVLALIADGHNNASIGRELLVTEETVKSHLRRASRALGANSRAHAVVLAIRAGEIPLHPPPTPIRQPPTIARRLAALTGQWTQLTLTCDAVVHCRVEAVNADGVLVGFGAAGPPRRYRHRDVVSAAPWTPPASAPINAQSGRR